MSRWSPTVQPTTQFASNEGLLQGITGASATLLRALEQRQGRKIDASRYADQQGRLDRGEARQTERDKADDALRQVQMQNSQLGALSSARDLGYVEGPTAGDRLAPVRGVGSAGLPGMAGVGASAASQLASALDAAPSSSMEVAGPMGAKSLRYDPTQTKDARDETRSLAMLGRQQGFSRDMQASGQEFQRGMQNDSQEFQGAQNAASRAQAASLSNLARNKPELITTPQGVVMVNPQTGQASPVNMDGQPVMPMGASRQPTEGERMTAALLPEIADAGAFLSRFDSPSALSQLAKQGGIFTNWANSDQGQQFNQAAEQYLRNVIYAKSGKGVTDDEMRGLKNIYIPMPGDGPDAIARKANARKLAEQGIGIAAGRAGPKPAPAPDVRNDRPPLSSFVRQP